ncbi:Ubiquitin fusion degradation protein 4 [Saitoella coloradoensis]
MPRKGKAYNKRTDKKNTASTIPSGSTFATSKETQKKSVLEATTPTPVPVSVPALATETKKRKATDVSSSPPKSTRKKRSKVAKPVQSDPTPILTPAQEGPSSVKKRSRGEGGLKTDMAKNTKSAPAEASPESSRRRSSRKVRDDSDLSFGAGGDRSAAELAEEYEQEYDHDEDEDDEHDDDEQEHDEEGSDDEEMGEGDYEDEDDEDDIGDFGGRFADPASLFGGGSIASSLRAMAGMMSSMSGRLKNILANLKVHDDPPSQLMALQELAEVLAVSTEDTLAGYFSPDQFVKELVQVMKGSQSPFEEDNPEMMLLACRCLANMMEALPGSVNNVVYGGAVPVLCQKLLEIQYIDLAEQSLTTLEKISVEYPTSIVREGGLTACLTYLDFFATNVQRTAVTTAANCCRSIPVDCFGTVRDVMPILQNVVTSSDQRVVEQGCLCVTRIVESFRHYPDKLEELISVDMLKTIITLLGPVSANIVGASIRTKFLRLLSIVAKASPFLTVAMFKANIVETVYQALTGVSPNENEEDRKNNSIMVMQALIHSSKEQVYETLNVIGELLPGIPKKEKDEDKEKEGEVDTPARKSRAVVENRLAMLKGCKPEVARFAKILLPTLIDVYASTINLNVRQKVLTALLKMAVCLDEEALVNAMKGVPFSSFLGGVLSQQETPSLMVPALQLAELLLGRLPKLFCYHFYREGVLAEVEKIGEAASQKVAQKQGKDAEVAEEASQASQASLTSETSVSTDASAVSVQSASTVKSSSRPGSATDLDVWAKRHAEKFISAYKHAAKNTKADADAANYMTELTAVASKLKTADKHGALKELVAYFSANDDSITTFELLNSGVVDALLAALTDGSEVENARAQRAFLSAFKGDSLVVRNPVSPFVVLVQKLQELLSRSERFEVITAHSAASDDGRRNSASMLAKQLRLKIAAAEPETEDIPQRYREFIVSIPAIATFKAVDEFLRSRLALSELARGGRGDGMLSSALAAFAAAAGLRGEGPSAGNKGKQIGQKTPSAAENAPAKKEKKSELEEPLECADEQVMSDPDDMDEIMDDVLDDLEDDMMQDQIEETVNVEVNNSGKATAKTEDGKKISTPTRTPSRTPAPPKRESSTPSSQKSLSYAGALQTAPKDYHFEFKIGDAVVTNETTIFGAVHQHHVQAQPIAVHDVFSHAYQVTWKKVPGPAPKNVEFGIVWPKIPESGIPASLEKDHLSASILHLLSILFSLNTNWRALLEGESEGIEQYTTLPLDLFTNSKLIAKMNRQLEEPLIIASACLPTWTLDLAGLFPFLFPFETRYLFLQSTSFGYSRSMARWQGPQRSGSRNDRDDPRTYLGQPQRAKVRISRAHLFESVKKVMELYGSSPSVLEVEYFDEVGTGLGPTLEFYTSGSREFCKKSLGLWRENDSDPQSEYAFGTNGLFPVPMSESELLTSKGKNILAHFKILGTFVARSMLDSRMIDVSFNPAFFRISDEQGAGMLNIAAIQEVDKNLAQSMRLVNKFVHARNKVMNDQSLSTGEKRQALAAITVDEVSIDDLALDFTLPGYPMFELIENGASVAVDINNVGEYVERVVDCTVGSGVRQQVKAFREGFSAVFPSEALKSFSAEELVMLFGQTEEDWSVETLSDSIKADHGFNLDSRTIIDLLSVLSSFTMSERRDFLQFITGSPKLPIGGFKALTPPFTIVCKPHEPPLAADDYLPSVMTCVNYLKLPDYSNADVLREKLMVAMKEGQGSFHLS